jgi:hypothetical protein
MIGVFLFLVTVKYSTPIDLLIINLLKTSTIGYSILCYAICVKDFKHFNLIFSTTGVSFIVFDKKSYMHNISFYE